ncbi:MAG: bifunctional riboflavin kinase/FAD synthetase [Verrucomicrobiia bacterium]|jgi:riboflavin kinase/FMN adenylyltransferase
MQVIRSFDELARVAHGVYMAIGVFDGVHVGHQRVIGQAREDARAAGGTSVALTFDPHPMRVLQPEKAPLLLTSTEHKLRLIEQLGADACLLMRFDKPFSETPAGRFIEMVADKRNQLREICVGTRFRFGHNRAGDVRLIEKLAATYGFIVKEIKSVHTSTGEMISSTAVRQHVLHGQIDRAAVMLGRPFSILGTVEEGDRVGRELGYPTANLNPHNEIMPPDGVYAGRVLIAREQFGGVANIGVRPTFANRDRKRVLEIHIFNFDRKIYGQDLEVLFLQKLRDERKFDSVDALRAQIAADEQTAREIIKSIDRGL